MIVVPILRFEKNDHIGTLKNLIASVIGDCKWYYGYVSIQFLTKNMEYFEIKDPVDFTDLNTHINEFLYNENEQENSYEKMVFSVIENMPKDPSDFGKFILVVTNLERIYTGANISEEILTRVDKHLIDKQIQLRTIRVEFDGKKTTYINPATFVNAHKIRNITSNIVRISLVETDSIIEKIKPCPELSLKEKIEHYRYSKHYLAEKWIQDHYADSFIGAVLLIFAVILSIGSCVFHIYERNYEKSNKITPIFPLPELLQDKLQNNT